MSFIIFDTEYTSWAGCNENGWHGFQKQEIVQIAAIKVSDKLEVLDTFDILCKPSINPIISDYFVNLTGITNELVACEGVPFEKAFKKFKKFVGNNVCLSHGYNGTWRNLCDGKIINKNFKLNKLQQDKTIKYYNIAAWLKIQYKKANLTTEPKNSGKIAKILGLNHELTELGLNEHNALYDVYSILKGVQYFKKYLPSLLKRLQ